jgi:CubicO group peptidase (beta-lactamase class C family)
MNFIKQGENGSLKLSYLFLGLAVEKASSQAYLDYVEKVILTPLGITDVKLAHSLPSLRDPKEANYLSPATCANVVSAEPASVPCADGGFNIEALYGDDGLIMSAPSMAKIMLNYTYLGDFNPHRATTQAAYFGGLPGVATIEVWLKGDVQIAVMLNSNSGNVDQFHTALIDATNSIKNWP